MRNRCRCVVLLGKSGAGKSVVANHLVGHDPLSPDEPPFADETEVKHEVVEFMWENDLYRVTVVDTPGLCFPDGIDDRIVQYIRETKLRIDLILFVLKKGRFTPDVTAMFSLTMAKFRENHSVLAIEDISSISALVVTGCEMTTTAQDLEQEFKIKSSTREIASQMGMRIYPVGFPNVKDFTNSLLQQACIQQMAKDRDTLWELIVRARGERGGRKREGGRRKRRREGEGGREREKREEERGRKEEEKEEERGRRGRKRKREEEEGGRERKKEGDNFPH